jgi:hypothetical protein
MFEILSMKSTPKVDSHPQFLRMDNFYPYMTLVRIGA